MTSPTSSLPPAQVGIIGFGAFGRLMARHLSPHVALLAHDPRLPPGDAQEDGARPVTLAEAAACPVVVLAVPVRALAATVEAIRPHLRPGALVADVGSVKCIPAAILRDGLPDHVEILGTHPLFGPQSARNGIAGLRIALCPIRGRQWLRHAAFLRRGLGLRVMVATPEEHDREAALAQGLTHLIAKVLVRMEPMPGRMTTRSFELIQEAVGMVRDDAPEVFQAIEHSNPFAALVRRRFFGLAAELDQELEAGHPGPAPLALASG
ncbi:prephenate dehydrogenase/arogenate dehydrogenase family protein [Pseudoroseomonas globiformis]|uniref:Prephenate dehydrogenase/arogenate dehydrogenase family protein n=1 Tax=Teichococcus globiformis TaxID=2307229 RepID=A0ABV7G4M9_9PROT